MDKITIIGASNCSACKVALRQANEMSIPNTYRDLDMMEEKERTNMIVDARQAGVFSLPIIITSDGSIVGGINDLEL